MPKIPHATPILQTNTLRLIETQALAAGQPLMARAGLAAAALGRNLAGETGLPILILAGPGNNGGDAFIAALHLRQWWYSVIVVYPQTEPPVAREALAAWQAWHSAGGTTHNILPSSGRYALVIDGLFGIGLKRAITGTYADLIGQVNQLSCPILAIDVPSGLDADTGMVMGEAIYADHTLSLIALKPGLLTLDGPDHSGDLHNVNLGLDDLLLTAPSGATIAQEVLAHLLPPRPQHSHKGTYGSVGILGGANGMHGALWLATRAALHLGAGRVYGGHLAADSLPIDSNQPEVMLRPASEVVQLPHLSALAIGPGLGHSRAAAILLASAIARPLPLLIDADGLNHLAANQEIKNQIIQRVSDTILTPHPAEAARLLHTTIPAIEADRLAAALQLASTYQASVVLKGNGSVCAWPDGHWAINTSGNPGMASAGMGDVLTGLIVALLAQGVYPRHALTGGVYLHGAAADFCISQGQGPIGLTASELILAARRLINPPLHCH